MTFKGAFDESEPKHPAEHDHTNFNCRVCDGKVLGLVFIGALRARLMMPYDCKWNGFIRELTAELEGPDMMVPEAEVYARINAKGAELMWALELIESLRR